MIDPVTGALYSFFRNFDILCHTSDNVKISNKGLCCMTDNVKILKKGNLAPQSLGLN